MVQIVLGVPLYQFLSPPICWELKLRPITFSTPWWFRHVVHGEDTPRAYLRTTTRLRAAFGVMRSFFPQDSCALGMDIQDLVGNRRLRIGWGQGLHCSDLEAAIEIKKCTSTASCNPNTFLYFRAHGISDHYYAAVPLNQLQTGQL